MSTKLAISIRHALLAGGAALVAWPAWTAEVTPERLINADKEPQNWLMNHRTYDGQRYSPLGRINTGNVSGLKLAYSVALGGGAGNEFNQATPLVENGFLFTVDSSAVVYKIDVRSGEAVRRCDSASEGATCESCNGRSEPSHPHLRTHRRILALSPRTESEGIGRRYRPNM